MAVNLSLIGGAGWQFFDDSGLPLSGGKIYTYAAGTTTPLTTYTSRDGLTANANPIILDAAGRTPQQIWSTEGLLYKYVVAKSNDVQIRVWDNIGGSVVASNLSADLANTADNSKGDALIGFRQSNSSGFLTGSTARTVNDKLQEVVSVKDFGAVGDATTDDTTVIQNAINVCAGKTLYFPAGTYIVTALTGVSNIHIQGDGWANTVLKRKNAAASTLSVLEFNGQANFSINGVGFDGNKANQSVGSNNVTIISCQGWEFSNNSSINAKTASGYGTGVYIGTIGSSGTPSRFNDNYIIDNDLDGVSVTSAWFIEACGNTFKGNGGAGLMVVNYTLPPSANISNCLNISNNYAISNAGNGIAVTGYVTGGTSSNPIFGPSVPQSRLVVISGNVCRNNGIYGIVFQGENGSVIGNQCDSNSRNVGFAAGILFNGSSSVCNGNTTRDNKSFGIDAGGSYFSVISNNQVMYEGTTDNVSATYINAGASLYCVVSDNVIQMGGTQQHTAIYYAGIDGDGTTPFPVIGVGTKITGNSIFCNNHASTTGISTARMATQATIQNNIVFNATDPMRAIMNITTDNVLNQNQVSTPSYSGSLVPSVASAATLIVPDWAETLYVTGSTGISNVMTYSQFVFSDKVRDVQITAQGSGYTPASSVSVTFTGGGGAGAAGYAEVDNGGRVIGIFMTNNGSGYTSAPTVAINGAGIGATGTAIVGLINNEGREISLMFQGALTMTDGGNINLAGNFTTTANKSLMRLRGAYGNWYEMSRSSL